MGNCLKRVEPFSLDKNKSQLGLGDYDWAYLNESGSYGSLEDYGILESAAPCRSCSLLDDSSLPFFIVTSVLGVLASSTVLFILFRSLFHWRLCPGWPVLAQLAVASALFSVAMPILAPGISRGHSTPLCCLGNWVWYCSAFAQALLIGCHACLGPKLGGEGQIPGLSLGLTVGLWGAATLLALPVTLASDTSQGLCTLASSRGLGALRFTHAAACFAIFVLLPLGLLGAKVLKKALGRRPGPWVSVLWGWFIFWWPHGMVLGFDALVRSKALPLQTCLAQQVLDVALHLAEAMAMLHCVAAPLLLALFYHQAAHASLSMLPLPARPASHLDAPEGKS